MIKIIILSLGLFIGKNDSVVNISEFKNRFAISFHPFSYIRLENAISNKFSIGTGIKFYHFEFQSGFKSNSSLRYFPFSVYKYFYIQSRLLLGLHKIIMVYRNEGGGTIYSVDEKIIINNKWNLGGSIDIGINLPLQKNKRKYIDISIGYNYYPFPNEIPLELNSGSTHYLAKEVHDFDFKYGTGISKIIGIKRWYDPLFGAGAPINFSITFGFVLNKKN